ncbi:MAG: ABC transporter ATP-binding protein [Bryobacteraceae bacterium]|nr:ABC transporter ATP-binding protein [Bryobacteraceae bacterium]
MNFPIRTYSIWKQFRGTTVLEDLCLNVLEGSIYGLVGPSGAGKTTAIKLLMNILRPSAGWSEVFGVDSHRLSPREFAQIGYVSENQEIPDWMTVGYFLKYWRPFYPTWDCDLAEELARQFQLPLNRKLRHLSRGMCIKAALASSLAYRPKLMILDEPFTGLDALVRDELIAGFLPRAENSTILISSHDLAEIETFASHIGYLEHGRLQFSEDLDTLRERFREIVLTFPSAPVMPAEWPANWLGVEAVGSVIRFVDARFSEERTPETVRHVFPDVREIGVNGMPLRSIFVTLAKAGRPAAA